VGDYTHLGMRERCLISTFLSMNVKISEIAERMGRHRSTIYRELARNTKEERYMPGIADALAKERHPHPPNKLQKNVELNTYVREHLENGWSPEQISGRMKFENKTFYICAESIYRFVYRHKNLGLYKFLPRRQPKRYRMIERNKHRKKQQMLMRHINLRAPEANLRSTIGHWEGDTIRFPKDQKTCVTTLVDRKSRFLFLRKNENKKSKTVIDHIFFGIKNSSKKIWRSITFDQGSEFMEFRKIERQTKCKIYFCDPRSPWQRPTNENTNGRLRRFLPKKFKIDGITQEYLDKIANMANNTPRKCLGYQTPREVITHHWKGFCRTAL
jgi:IS30 family transposase